ncbi:MAG: zinc transporter ZupT [Tissierellia bacterium]|nr:zinc transporter ZupT [Tissierellia bacterium]
MEHNVLIAFLITGIAGLTTLVGTVLLFFTKKTNTKFLSASLGFSAGAMIFISFVDIMPKAQEQLLTTYSEKTALLYTVLAFFAGMLILALIDKLIPEAHNPHEMQSTEDIEHVKETPETEPENMSKVEKNKLMKMGFFTALAITIHNFPEGIATFISTVKDPSLGIPIAVAIAIHNIPEGISVAVPVYYGSGSKRKAFLYSFISAIAEPIGGLFAYFIFLNNASDAMIGIVFAAVAGIMTFISLDELLPAAEEYGNHHTTIYGCIAGMAFMALSLILLA